MGPMRSIAARLAPGHAPAIAAPPSFLLSCLPSRARARMMPETLFDSRRAALKNRLKGKTAPDLIRASRVCA